MVNSVQTDEFPFVSILLPSWNRKERILSCLESVEKLEYPKEKLEIVIVDNASTDGSPSAIRSRFGGMRSSGYANLLLLENATNLGAPAAYNRALEHIHAHCQFVWKMDNDITFEPQYLYRLVAVLINTNDMEVGAAGGRLCNGATGDEEPCGAHLRPPPRRWMGILDLMKSAELIENDKHSHQLVMLVGASVLFRREMFERYGSFDGRFFLYYDETEYCLRLWKNGIRFIIEPRATAYHHRSFSRRSIPVLETYYMTRNHLIFGSMLFTGAERLMFFVVQMLTLPGKYAKVVLLGSKGNRLKATLYLLVGLRDFVLGRSGPSPTWMEYSSPEE